MKAVLFDIDGTIMRAGGAGRKALAQGVDRVVGCGPDAANRAVDTMDFRGATDSLLVAELAQRVGAPDLDVGHLFRAYLESLDEGLRHSEPVVLPGVQALLEQLDRRPDVLVGLLTGNIREGARIKLRSVGLDHLVELPGGFGDDGHIRNEVAARAKTRMLEAGANSNSMIVIGDTERDVEAGQHISAKTVAVTTGWTDSAALRAAGADLVLDDLSAPQPLIQILDSL